MGNSDSKNVQHKIVIQTERQNYSSGDCITGTVDITFLENIKANQLILQFYGIEKTKIQYETQSKEGNYMILQNKQILTVWHDQQVKKGDYIYPFRIQLPQDIPGSCVKQFDRKQGSIQYYISVELDNGINTNVPMKYQEEIKLIQGQPTQSFQFDMLKHEGIVQSSTFCFSNGSTQIQTLLDKPYYVQGEPINLTYIIDNSSCSKDIQAIKYNLLQQSILKLQYNPQENVFGINHNEYKFQKIIKYGKKLAKIKSGKQDTIYETIQLMNLDTSITGNLIQVEYILTVDLEYNSSFTGSNTSLQIPILILDKNYIYNVADFYNQQNNNNNYPIFNNQNIPNNGYNQQYQQRQFNSDQKYPQFSNNQNNNFLYLNQNMQQNNLQPLDDALVQQQMNQCDCSHDQTAKPFLNNNIVQEKHFDYPEN